MQLSDTALAKYFINALTDKNGSATVKAAEIAEFLRAHEAPTQSVLAGLQGMQQYMSPTQPAFK